MTTPSAPRLLACLLLFFAIVMGFTAPRPSAWARDAPAHTAGPDDPTTAPRIHPSDGAPRLVSGGTGPGPLAKATGDTFWIYGGPGTLEGRFETANGAPDAQGWTGVDISDTPNFWQVSTFNAATLGGNGAGNRAAWAGRDVDQVEGWIHAPGYGNDWNEILSWTSPPLADTSVAQEVELDFHFHHDLEPGYDFFTVQYDSAGILPGLPGYYAGAGTSGSVFSTDGTDADTNGQFQAPGVRFSDVQQAPIVYAGGDYAGPDGDRIVILLRVTSDGAWSDEDGLWVTNAGAVQVDDLRVRWDDGTGVIQESLEDFEGPDPFVDGAWRREKAPFAGDFSSVLPNLTDIDPCWENRSPVVNFLDRGQTIGNAESAAEFPGIPTSTGGSFSTNWNYGTPQGHVLNYTGGVSKQPGDTFDGPANLFNEFWSPPFDYDLPGPEDDDPAVAGLLLQSHQYEHMPLANGLFWIWSVRARTTSEGWTEWRDRNFVFYGNSFWELDQRRIEDLFPETDIEQMQISLGVWDLASLFGFPGSDGTPGFYFDNVAMAKLRLDGPVISTRPVDLALGGFPESGTLDASTLAGRDALDVRFDMARNIDYGWANETPVDPGDSVIVDVDLAIPSTTLADLALVWVLDRNSLFDDVRTPPSRPEDRNVDTTSDPARWTGETVGQISTTSSGTVVEDRWFFDLPDVDFLYPGDVLRYHVRATDDAGNVSTLPRDVGGFPDGEGYPEAWTIRALPSLQDAAGGHPRVLVVDYAADGAPREQLSLLLDQLGWVRGVDYDLFRRSHTWSMVSDGIGGAGAHGATAGQLAGYRTLLFAHAGSSYGMSNGADDSGNDRSPDTAVVREWLDLPGARSVVHLGVDAGGGLANGTPVYAQEVLGVEVAGAADPVREAFTVRHGGLAIGPEFEIHGGCRAVPGKLGGRLLGHVELYPHGGGTVGHWFEDTTSGAPVQPATVYREWTDLVGDRKVAVTVGVRPGESAGDAPHPGGLLATSVFVRDLLAWADGSLVFGTPTDAPSLLRPRLDVAPTPFNPSTTLSLVIPRAGRTSVVAYDLRGRRVRTLLDARLDAGVEHRISWDGRDDRGAPLASGVYFLAAEAPDWSERRKVMLLK